METVDDTVPRRRRGRVGLLAAVGIVAVTAAVTIGLVVPTDSDPAPVRPSATAIETPSRVDASTAGNGELATGNGELTRGPLMAASPPLSVTIPALEVTSSLVGLGLTDDGRMEVPDNAEMIGWFASAPTPGSLGPAILAGHVNWKNKPGVFVNLARLAAGDTISVARQDGSTARFAVTRVERYPKNSFPTDAVYGAIDHAGLRLITCGGEFDASRHSYRDNVVVFADLRHAS